jgi:hypothetical protein
MFISFKTKKNDALAFARATMLVQKNNTCTTKDSYPAFFYLDIRLQQISPSISKIIIIDYKKDHVFTTF